MARLFRLLSQVHFTRIPKQVITVEPNKATFPGLPAVPRTRRFPRRVGVQRPDDTARAATLCPPGRLNAATVAESAPTGGIRINGVVRRAGEFGVVSGKFNGKSPRRYRVARVVATRWPAGHAEGARRCGAVPNGPAPASGRRPVAPPPPAAPFAGRCGRRPPQRR